MHVTLVLGIKTSGFVKWQNDLAKFVRLLEEQHAHNEDVHKKLRATLVVEVKYPVAPIFLLDRDKRMSVQEKNRDKRFRSPLSITTSTI